MSSRLTRVPTHPAIARTNTRFVTENYDPGYRKMAARGFENRQLRFDVYVKDSQNVSVLVAFRGTRGPNADDWFANFSWFTGVIPVQNAYDWADIEFAKLQTDIAKAYPGRPVSYIATGHSLGGGLAQHVAYNFDCVSAVVFDTSPVRNTYYLSDLRTPTIVHLYDRQDELTRFKRLSMVERDSATYRWYPLDLVPPGGLQHRMTELAVGMAGMVAKCQIAQGDCQIPLNDMRAIHAYCPTYGHKDEVCQRYLK